MTKEKTCEAWDDTFKVKCEKPSTYQVEHSDFGGGYCEPHSQEVLLAISVDDQQEAYVKDHGYPEGFDLEEGIWYLGRSVYHQLTFSMMNAPADIVAKMARQEEKLRRYIKGWIQRNGPQNV